MFKVGDKVKYTSGIHGDTSHNPVWGGKHGYIEGVVVAVTDIRWDGLGKYSGLVTESYSIKWDNERSNSYTDEDFVLAKPKVYLDEELFEI